MSSRLVVNANQHQQWIEGDRSESIGRHALDLAFVVHRDHGYACGKACHGPAEIFLICAHLNIFSPAALRST